MTKPISLLLFVALLATGSLQNAGAAPKDLFNGRNLDGWVAMHGGEWSIVDGVLIGKNGTNWSIQSTRLLASSRCNRLPVVD